MRARDSGAPLGAHRGCCARVRRDRAFERVRRRRRVRPRVFFARSSPRAAVVVRAAACRVRRSPFAVGRSVSVEKSQRSPRAPVGVRRRRRASSARVVIARRAAASRWTTRASSARGRRRRTTATTRRATRAPVGLRGSVNMGNTCFLASILQTLVSTAPVVEYFLRENHTRRAGGCEIDDCVACAFDEYVSKAYDDARVATSSAPSTASTALVAGELLYAWWVNEPSMAKEQQQDAHEFFLSFLSVAHANVLGRSIRPRKKRAVGLAALLSLEAAFGDDDEDEYERSRNEAAKEDAATCECVFHTAFAGVLRSDIACASCGASTTTREATTGVSLDVPPATKSSRVSLMECLSNFTAVETIENASRRVCSACAVVSESHGKQTRFERVPKILNFHFKRFEGDFKSMRKNDIHVDFPFDLDMSPYRAHDCKETNHDAAYELYSVVQHSGVLEGGHYVAYVRRDGAWFLCDDAVVREADENEVKSSQAFMLFYKLRA